MGTLNRQVLQHLRTNEQGKKVQAGQIEVGEIAVRYSEQDPALMIKDVKGNIVEFVSSGAVFTTINNLSAATEAVINAEKVARENADSVLSEAVSALSATMITYVSGVTDDVFSALSAVSGHIETTIISLSGDAKDHIEKVDGKLNELSSSTVSFSAATVVAFNAAQTARQLIADDVAKLSAGTIAEDAAIRDEFAAADTILDGKITSLSGDAKSHIENVKSSLTSEINNKYTAATTYTDTQVNAEKVAREAAEETINGKIATLSADVNTINEKIEEVTGDFSEELSAVSGYIKTTIIKLSGDVEDRIESVETAHTKDITDLSGAVSTAINAEKVARQTADSELTESLATLSADTDAAIAAAKSEAISTAAADATSKDNALHTEITGEINNAKTDLTTLINTKYGAATAYTNTEITAEKAAREIADETLSGAIKTLSGGIITYVDNKISTVYKVKGTVQDMAALQAIVNPENGDVYNMLDEYIPEGGGSVIPAGTNWVWVKEGTSGHWDALGGTFDMGPVVDLENDLAELSSVTKAFSAATVLAFEAAKTARQTIADDVAKLSAGTMAADTAIRGEFAAADTALDGKITALSGNAKTHILAVETSLTNTINNKYVQATGYTDTKITSEKTAREAADDALSGAISALTEIALTKAGLGDITGVPTATLTGTLTQQSGAYMAYSDNEVTLDLRYLNIDCGTF